MGFWGNISKLIDLTLTHGSGNILILLRNELESKINYLENQLRFSDTNQGLRISDLEKELSDAKYEIDTLQNLIRGERSKNGLLENKVSDKEKYITSIETEYDRLKKIEQLAKSLEKDFTRTLSDNKNQQLKNEALGKENLRLKQIESLARNIESEVANMKSKLQAKEQDVIRKDSEVVSLSQKLANLETALQNERMRHSEEIKRIAKEEREKVMKQVSDAVIESVVPIIKSDRNPIPDRVLFDEVNENKQKLFIREERMEANTKLSEIQVRQAQHEAKQAQYEVKVEKGLMQIREEKMLVDYGRIQNELMSYELTMRDYIQNKQVEFMKHELAMQTYMVEMSKNIVIADGKLLESEKNKMLVLEQVAQMGIEIKKQETYLEKSLLLAERLKFDADKQNFVNQQQEEQITLAIGRFDVDYSNKMLDISRKELDLEKLNFSNLQFQDNIKNVLIDFQTEYERNKLELERSMHGIEKGSFTNQVESVMLEMQKQTFDIQNHLKSLAYERQDLDMYFREKQVALGDDYNKVHNATLQNERILDKIDFERRDMQMQDKMESLKFQFSAAMDNARFQYQSQMANMQNQMSGQQNRIEKESIKNAQLQLQNTRLKDSVNQYYGRKK